MENSMITTKNIQQKKKVKSKTGFGMTCPINNDKPKPKLPSVYLIAPYTGHWIHAI